MFSTKKDSVDCEKLPPKGVDGWQVGWKSASSFRCLLAEATRQINLWNENFQVPVLDQMKSRSL